MTVSRDSDIFQKEPVLAAMARENAPLLALSSDGARVVAATHAGGVVFSIDDETTPPSLFRQIERALPQIARTGAPGLLRLRLGGLRPVTVKAQKMRLNDASVMVLLALDAPAVKSVPPSVPQAAEEADVNVPAETGAGHGAANEPSAPLPEAGAEAEVPDSEGDEVQASGTNGAPQPETAPEIAPELTMDAAEAPERDSDDVQPDAIAAEQSDTENEPEDNAPIAVTDTGPETTKIPPSAPVHKEKPEPIADTEASASRPRALRFVWQTDEAGAISMLSPEFGATVGRDVEAFTGKSWLDVVAAEDIRDDGRLAKALSRRDTWSGVTILWPLDSGRVLPVDLAGLPMFDRDRTFRGFRGFGVCREPRAIDVSAAAGPVDLDTDVKSDDLQAPTVVPFPEPRDPARPALNPSERTAFREIARALGSAPVRTRRAPGDIGNETDAPAPVVTLTPAPPAQVPADDSVQKRRRLSFDERRDSSVLDALPLGVFIHRSGVPIFANKAFLELAGYGDIDALAAADAEALFDAADATRGVQVRKPDGSTVSVESNLKQINWDGEPASLMIVQPVKAKQADEVSARLSSELREMKAILDTATDGVLVLDAEARILSANRSAEALFGYDAAELHGLSLMTLLASESHPRALDYFDGLRANGVASVLNDGREVMGVVRRGGVIPLFMTLGRLDEGEMPRFCAVLRDITQFKMAEEDLRAAKQEAERTSAHKSDFLARVSHEIRTPLNAILGFAEVMIDGRFGPVGNERYVDYLKDIHASGEHVISLVNDLLDLSKIEAGRLELTFAGLSLNDIVKSGVSLIQPQAGSARVIVRMSLAPHLPQVVADERSVRQIVLNLLSNAVKFTPPGGQVIISTALTDLGQAVIRVRDTGVGMNEREIQAALEPFRQVSVSARGGGTGLGLPLTKALAEANRATFAIQSAANTGTLVEIIFPPTRVLAE